jgi:hypothetical protein
MEIPSNRTRGPRGNISAIAELRQLSNAWYLCDLEQLHRGVVQGEIVLLMFAHAGRSSSVTLLRPKIMQSRGSAAVPRY